MADLRVREFPEDLLRAAKSEASLRGKTLRQLVMDAVQREVDRLRAEDPDQTG